MEASLEAIARKVGRAKKNLATFRGELDAFDASRPYDAVQEFDSQGRLEAVRFRVFTEPDPEWHITVGEIAYQVRSALDQLVTQLVILNGGDPDEHRGSFPIYVESEDYWKELRRKGGGRITRRDVLMLGVAPEHKAIIDGLQPYQRGSAALADRDPLEILRVSCNRDKHGYGHPARFVLRSTASVHVSHRTETIEVLGRDHGLSADLIPAQGVPIEDGTDLLPFLSEGMTAIDRPVDVQALRVGVAFGPARILLPDLKRVIRYVEKRVVARFQPFF